MNDYTIATSDGCVIAQVTHRDVTDKVDTYTPSRSMMTAGELRLHKMSDGHGDPSGDGYDRMEQAHSVGWRSIASWGRDGWDMLEWPYYVASWKHEINFGYFLMTDCENDITVYRFATKSDFEAAVDYLFNWNRLGESDSYDEITSSRELLDAGELEIDPKFRGPYRSN